MRIRHLNCVTACPLGGMLMDGVSTSLSIARLTSHCLLVESKAGVVHVLGDPIGLDEHLRMRVAVRGHHSPLEL